MKLSRAAKVAMPDQWFRYWMPYHLERLEDRHRRHVYLPVNRNYKPLGITASARVDYQTFRQHAMVFATDPAKFDDIWTRREGGLWLYNDSPDSRADYFARLERLFSRSVRLSAKISRSN